jgi:hypothetical protein
MKLREMWSYNEQGFEQQKNYDANSDISVLDKHDTRKTRLKLKDINRMRLSSEAHDKDQQEQTLFVQKMYGAQPAAEDNLTI